MLSHRKPTRACLADIEDYFQQQAAMMNRELKPLTAAQQRWIKDTWPETMDIKKFMTSKILSVPTSPDPAGSSSSSNTLAVS